jgi:hypothetical protein
MRTWTAIPLLVALAIPPAEAAKKIFSVSDPKGDDHGDGALVYPFRDDLRPGDLDVVEFAARPGNGGTEFEIVFAKAVRKPEGRVVDVGGANVEEVARLGFYTFNVDVYVDTDRETGSGSTNSLPGRNLRIAEADAWERAVVLNPRPEAAKEALKRMLLRDIKREKKAEGERVGQDRIDGLRREIGHEVETRTFFPAKVAVAGSKVRFFVPDAFLGGPARPDWGYVVVVTGADIDARFDIPSGETIGWRGDTLMVMERSISPSTGKFGGGREGEGDFQSPVVDYIAPPGTEQESLLSAYDVGAGTLAALPAVVPATAEAK